MSTKNPAITFSALIIVLLLTLLIARITAPDRTQKRNLEQEMCTEMGKVMETEKAVAVGSMCCTEYTCLEIKR